MVIYLTIAMILALLVCYAYDIDIVRSKNVYLLFIAILMLFLYKDQNDSKIMEGMTNAEAIQNVASVYSKENMIVDNLTVTGKTILKDMDVTGNTTLKNVDVAGASSFKGTFNVDANGKIKLLYGPKSIVIDPNTGLKITDLVYKRFRQAPGIPTNSVNTISAGHIQLDKNKKVGIIVEPDKINLLGAGSINAGTVNLSGSFNAKNVTAFDTIKVGSGRFARTL